MKKVSLVIDITGIELPPDEKKETPEHLFWTVTQNVLLGYANQQRGFTEPERRQYYKISDAFEVVLKDKGTEVELEDDWVGLLRKAFREAKLMPNKLLRVVENNIEAIKDR